MDNKLKKNSFMKYLKYKKKYLELYKQPSGNPTNILYHGTNLYFIEGCHLFGLDFYYV